MNEEIQKTLNLLNQKVDKIEKSVEKTRKYFLATLVISLVVFVLPLIGLMFAIPAFLSSYASALQSF